MHSSYSIIFVDIMFKRFDENVNRILSIIKHNWCITNRRFTRPAEFNRLSDCLQHDFHHTIIPTVERSFNNYKVIEHKN